MPSETLRLTQKNNTKMIENVTASSSPKKSTHLIENIRESQINIPLFPTKNWAVKRYVRNYNFAAI